MRRFSLRDQQPRKVRLRCRRQNRHREAEGTAGDRLLSAGEERRDPLYVMVVVRMIEGRRSRGRMMRFVVAMNDGRMIAMMIGGPRMDVLRGKRGQRGQGQSRNRRRHSAKFTA